MTYPIPGESVYIPYGKSGSMWSHCGWHTGVDFAADYGTTIYAPIDGQVRHRNYGSSFGSHQFVLSPDPDQPFGDGEVFFAHTYDRPPDGKYVLIGEPLAHVGEEGNADGPHLHLEYHPETKDQWCHIYCANPQVILDHVGGAPPSTGNVVYLEKLHYGQQDSDSVRHLQEVLNGHPLTGGETLPISGNYLDETDEEVRLCQVQHGYGNDPAGHSYVGPSQADHLFAGKGYTIVYS